MRSGVRIGLDPGDARIGVARSDPSGLLATPVETVKRGRGDLDRLVELLREAQDGDPERVVEVVVGLPRSLAGVRALSKAAMAISEIDNDGNLVFEHRNTATLATLLTRVLAENEVVA